MANKRIETQLSTEIGLNMLQASESLKSLSSVVRTTTSAWKAQTAQMKSAGDYMGAAQAKVDGLKNSMSPLQREIDVLKQKQSELKLDTEQGANQWAKYETKINNLNRQMSNYSAQLTRAENSMRGYTSGIIQLRNEIKQNEDVNKSYVDKLKAENKQYGANRAEMEHSKQALAEYRTLYQRQSDELQQYGNKMKSVSSEYTSAKNKLNELESAGKKNTTAYQEQEREVSRLRGELNNANDSYVQQKIRVNEAGTSIAESNNKIKAMHKSVGNMSDKQAELADKLRNTGNKASEMGDKFNRAGQVMSVATMGIGAGMAYGAKKASDLQNEYKQVTNLAVTGGEKQAEAQNNVNKMYKDGEQYSIKYGVSQGQLANGYKELIKRGYDSNQALGAQKSLVEASIASGDSYKDVVHNATTALDSFGLRSKSTNGMIKNTNKTVNEMAYASDKTSTNFSDMGKAMEYVGASAHQSGQSMHETASAIGLLSNQGLEADKAGTGLRKVLVSLQSPSANAKKAMSDLGLSTKDFVGQDGKMKSMTDIFELLNSKTDKMSKAQQGAVFHNLFGTTGQQAGAILADSADQLRKLDGEVQKSTEHNYVEKLAEKNMKSYKNEMKSAKESANALAITMGTAILPVITDLLGKGAKLADDFERLPKSTKTWITYAGLAVAAIGPLSFAIGGILKTVKGISSVATATMKLFGGKSKAVQQQEEYSSILAQNNKLLQEQIELQKADVDGSGTPGNGKTSSEESAATESESVAGSTEKASSVGKYGGRAMSGAKGGAALGVVAAGTNLIGMNDHNRGNKIGGSAGMLAGSIGGGALGTAVGGPIGGMIGSSIGTAIGQKVGETAGPAIEKNLKKNHIAQNIGKWWKSESKDVSKEIDANPPKLSMKKSFDQLNKETKKYYSDRQKQDLNNLKLLKKNGDLTDAEYKKRVAAVKKSGEQGNKYEKLSGKDRANISKYYAQQEQSTKQKWNKKLLDDEWKYGKNSTKFKQDENKRKEALDKLHHKFESGNMADEARLHETLNGKIQLSSNKQTGILKKLYDEKGKLSKHSLNQMIIDSTDETNKTIAEANKRYSETVKSAKKKRDDTISAAKDEFKGNSEQARQQREKVVEHARNQYNDSVKNASKQKDETIKHADSQHDKVVAQAHDQNKNVSQASADQQKSVAQHSKDQEDNTKVHINTSSGFQVGYYNLIADIMNVFGAHMKKKEVKKYASGTGLISNIRNAITKPTLAMLNDGVDSPETSNREMALLPNGKAFIPKERNWTGILPAGTEVLNAKETKLFMQQSAQHFAEGTGFIDGLVSGTEKFAGGVMKDIDKAADAIGDIVSDPMKTFNKIFKPKDITGGKNRQDLSSEKTLNAMYQKGSYKSHKDQANKWWSALWDMVKGITDGDDSKKNGNNELDKLIKGELGSMLNWIDKNAGGDAGGHRGDPSGSGVQRWKDDVKKALKANGLSDDESMVNRVLRQISTESGGNSHAKQAGGDPDHDGSGPAMGLMQTKRSTFMANAFPGHTDIFNGYDSLLSGLKYAKKRYGPGLSFLGNGHGYANGGFISRNQLIEVGEDNKEEAIIPLTKTSRAWELIGKSAARVAQNDPSMNDSNENSDIEKKLDGTNKLLEIIVGSLGKLTGLNQQQIDAIFATSQNEQQRYRRDAKNQSIRNYGNLNGGIV